MLRLIAITILVSAISAFPYDSIISKLDDGVRYQYMLDGNGIPHLVDLWGTTSDLVEASRYNPDAENVYHLFTRLNPTVSQPMVLGNKALLSNNFDPKKKTVILIHGWIVDINGILGTNMIPGKKIRLISSSSSSPHIRPLDIGLSR
ncbi:uncharacterized protein LOC113508663 [Trichoplusia ni]|uniref:Uncharacterized protein LOC113508663 n=1 Tax=Trichoplusia ni TaxID=7111 RepID=A0A7E5X2V5_TRINI|nr:uncharacterized protein LOC113508663 [Trichoplusia ni]